MKILLTGGSGFIGKNFFEHYRDEYDLLAPSHQELDLTNTNQVNNFFKKNSIDLVLHCASIGGKRNDNDDSNTFEQNLKIFFNIVRQQDKFKKMIHLGSGAEYNKSKNIYQVKEDDFDKSVPQDKYGFYKYVCSKYIQNSDKIYCLRLFGVFGKYEDYRVKFISNLICKYILKLPLTMIQDACFSYVYIDDLIKILKYFINKKPKHKFYNIGPNKKNSLLSLAKKINQLDNYSLEIIIQKKGFNKEYSCNNSRLRKEIKNFNFQRIDTSIKNLYLWYKNNIKSININSL